MGPSVVFFRAGVTSACRCVDGNIADWREALTILARRSDIIVRDLTRRVRHGSRLHCLFGAWPSRRTRSAAVTGKWQVSTYVTRAGRTGGTDVEFPGVLGRIASTLLLNMAENCWAVKLLGGAACGTIRQETAFQSSFAFPPASRTRLLQ